VSLGALVHVAVLLAFVAVGIVLSGVSYRRRLTT
jgi:hypothetical protein